MEAPWLREINSWNTFYVFVGTAAATLMGLIFVVVSLGRSLVGTDRAMQDVRAFYTPIIAFFSTIILTSAVMLLPHATPKPLTIIYGVLGIVGLGYMANSGVLRRWRANALQLDDLLYYMVLPILAYSAMCIVSLALWTEKSTALSIAAGVMILLLFIGIRNSWDLVLYIARRENDRNPRDP